MRRIFAAGALLTTLALLTFSTSPPSFADNSSDDPIAPMLGQWEGNGTLFGRTGEFFMNWEYGLGNRFIHLTFQNPVLEAEAFYRTSEDGGLVGTWFDSRGVEVPLKATLEESVLESHWGTPETEQGRTRYHLVSPNEMEVTDFVLRDGEWAQFGQAHYSRSVSQLDGLGWLLGTWVRETEKSLTTETWTRLSARTFEGESIRTSKESGDVVFTEALRLVEMQNDVFYLPKVSENDDPVPFKLVSVEGDRVVFENPNHDFPQRIVYERQSDTEMIATVGGLDEKSRQIEFRFQRNP